MRARVRAPPGCEHGFFCRSSAFFEVGSAGTSDSEQKAQRKLATIKSALIQCTKMINFNVAVKKHGQMSKKYGSESKKEYINQEVDF